MRNETAKFLMVLMLFIALVVIVSFVMMVGYVVLTDYPKDSLQGIDPIEEQGILLRGRNHNFR